MFWKSEKQHFICFKDASNFFWCFIIAFLINRKLKRHQIWQNRYLLDFVMLCTIVFLFKILFFHCYFSFGKSDRWWQTFCCLIDDYKHTFSNILNVFFSNIFLDVFMIFRNFFHIFDCFFSVSLIITKTSILLFLGVNIYWCFIFVFWLFWCQKSSKFAYFLWTVETYNMMVIVCFTNK